MKNKFPKIIASALIEKDNKFLLIKEILEDDKEYWIIPGGKIEFGEKIIDAVKREIKEETNLDIEITKFIDFKEAIFTDHDYHTIILFFHAKPLSNEIVYGETVKEAKFFTVEEAKDLALVGTAKWLFQKHFIDKND